jgi:uncharacterized metal-binding protein
MPSGRIHASSSAVLAVPACFLTLGYSGNWTNALACGAGCLAGIALTPDLDQEGLSSSEYWIIKWTLGLGFLWMMLWYPYARLCKHRSIISHFPLIGTAGRVAYLLILPLLAVYFLGWQPPRIPQAPLMLALGGLAASDILHWAMDTRSGDRSSRRRSRR